VYLRAWILFCALLVAAGWILSCFRALTPWAFGISMLLALAAAVAAQPWRDARVGWEKGASRLVSRFARVPTLLPSIYLFSLALLLLRTLLFPPFHDDGLCYRIPRAMTWIMDRGLSWVSAQDPRIDDRATVSEWLTVPVLMFLRTDRLVFLPNFISALFLPGLIFSLWRRLGVSPPVAWIAMWLVPTGFCFALQAFNSSNDSLAAIFAIAAFDFLFRAREGGRWSDAIFSILSLALATGVKLNCLPLALPWLALALPLGRKVMTRPLATAGVLALAALVSFLPTGILNLAHGGGFTGLALEKELVAPPLAVALVGNTALITLQNVMMPPLNEIDLLSAVNGALNTVGVNQLLNRYFEAPSPCYYTYVAIEQAGLGYLVLLGLGFAWAATRKRKGDVAWAAARTRLIFFSLTGIAFLQFLAAAYTNQPARIMAVFYLLLTPMLLIGDVFVSHRLFRLSRLVAAFAMVMGLQLQLLETENPLFGSPRGYDRMREDARLTNAAQRCFGATPGAIGIIRTWNQREAWLWQPYGTRRVIEFSAFAGPVQERQAGVRYLAISAQALAEQKWTIDEWLARSSARLIARQEEGSQAWYFAVLT